RLPGATPFPYTSLFRSPLNGIGYAGMRRLLSILLAFALSSGETLSLAATTVFHPPAAPTPYVPVGPLGLDAAAPATAAAENFLRSEEHTSELQSPYDVV